MADKNLERVVTLGVEFKNAVEANLVTAANQEKIMKSMKPGELDQVMELVQTLASESLQYAFGGEPDDDFLKLNLKAVEVTADLSLRAVSAKKVAAYVPDGLKNAADIAFLRENGAEKFAQLCEGVAAKPAAGKTTKRTPKK